MEWKVLKTFLYNHKLKFSEIEKQTKLRSNKLAYYLKKLEKEGVLIKQGEFYKLSETAEILIPYLSEKKSALCVLLIALEKKRKVFLYKREKRPFKDKLSLPGGRLLLGESIREGVRRIMKEKFDIKTSLKKINSVSLEHVKKKKIVHSFLLIFVTGKTKQEIEYVDIEKNKKRIIGSDYKLIKEDLNKEINIRKFFTKD